MNSIRRVLGQLVRQLETSYSSLNRIELSKSALLHNLDYLKALSGAEYIIPVLKANAYGHGIESIAEILDNEDIPYVAVDGYHEALEVQATSDLNVLVMGAILPENVNKLDQKKLAFVVQDMAILQVLTNVRRPIKIHLEFNTGMNRQGFDFTEIKSVIRLLKDNDQIELDGLMSHFYDADNEKTDKAVREQSELFDSIVKEFWRAKLKPRYIHLQQTAGSTKSFTKTANTIRPGIGIYGISPLHEHDPYHIKLDGLKPVLSAYSRIIKIRELKAGDGVSYNHVYHTKTPARVGVVPFGYYDGMPKELSGKISYKVKGKLVPQIGRICMNHSMIDITESKAKLWDEVEIISRDKDSPNSIQNISKQFDIFPYSLLVKIAPDTRREIVD